MKWQKENWKRNFKVYRQEKKEEAAVLPKLLIVARRRWWSRFSQGTDQARPSFEAMCHVFFKRFGTLSPPAG